MTSGLVIVLVCVASIFGTSWCQRMNYQQEQHQILESILNPEKYDARIRPNGRHNTSAPVIVTTNLYIRNIVKLDDFKMDFSVQITFRNQWTDDRLVFSDRMSYINLHDSKDIWTPDIFFSNEKDGKLHTLMKPNSLLRIHPDGRVLFSNRISLRLACPMNLKDYPHDMQTCQITMPSYSYTTDDMVLNWKEGDPIQVIKNMHLPSFHLKQFKTGHCTAKTITGEYSCLKVEFLFKRDWKHYLITIYIPSVMLLLVSYLHFWLNPSATTGRILLALGSLLAMAAGCVSLSNVVPHTSYTKAIDVWTGICNTFLFASLVEFAVIHYLARKESRKLESSKSVLGVSKDGTMTTIAVENPKSDTGDAEPFENSKVELSIGRRICKTYHDLPRLQRIDVISRVAYPLLILLFNIIYWSVYLPKQVQDEDDLVIFHGNMG